MQQNYRFNIDGWLLIWKVRNALFCETSNMTFHEGSLKNNFGPWKVLEKPLKKDFNFLCEPWCPGKCF